MNRITNIGATLLTLGVISFLLSLVDLQFKALSFLGEYKGLVELASVVIGIILLILGRLFNKNENGNEEQNVN